MYRRRRENRRKLLQSITLWHPVILLFFMFILGACANTKGTATISPSEISKGAAAGTVLTVEQPDSLAAKEREQSSEALFSAAESLLEGSSELQPGSAAEEETAREYQQALAEKETTAAGLTVHEAGNYTSKEEVALYLHLYRKLPSNYITKKRAEAQGWDSKKGNLDEILPGMSIGGSTFGNYEGLLPTADGRKYYECDIDYDGGYRNAKRIIYSGDGLIFYTEDHYKSFEQLY